MTAPRTSATDAPGANGANGTFSADVVAFAVANQAEHCLQPLLEATRRIFPTAHFVTMSVEVDPELRDNTQIVIHVQVAGLALDELRAADKQWGQEMLCIYPPLRKILFCLRLDLKS